MLLSIIIPIYNVEKYLSTTLDCVLNQTFRDFELILVDDGSTDSSGEICDQYAKNDNRIKVIHKKNEGVSEARNVGVATASGDYIGFVDSDDIIEPIMYEHMVKAALDYDCEIVQCEHDRHSTQSNISYEITDENFTISTGEKVVGDIFIKTGGRCTNILALWSKIYKRELFDGIIFPYGKVYEDEARTYQVILKARKVGELNVPLYHYVERNNSIITGIAIHKCLDKAWALKDRMDFFRNKNRNLFFKSVSSYLNFLKSTYVNMLKGIVIYTNEDKQIQKLLNESYSDFKLVADKYTLIYLFMIKHKIMINWIVKNEFEPIQKIFARIKRWKYQ